MEGGPSQHIIDHDFAGSNTVTSFDIDGLHIEMNGDANLVESLIKIRQEGGQVSLRGVYSQMGGVTQVHTNTGACIVKLENWRYIPVSTFKAEGGNWIIEDCYNLAAVDYKNTGWKDDLRPSILIVKNLGATECVFGSSLAFRVGESEFVLDNANRVKFSQEAFINNKNKTFQTPKDITNYQLVDAFNLTTKDALGNNTTVLIPILKQK
jgi:hypothetical protein